MPERGMSQNIDAIVSSDEACETEQTAYVKENFSTICEDSLLNIMNNFDVSNNCLQDLETLDQVLKPDLHSRIDSLEQRILRVESEVQKIADKVNKVDKSQRKLISAFDDHKNALLSRIDFLFSQIFNQSTVTPRVCPQPDSCKYSWLRNRCCLHTANISGYLHDHPYASAPIKNISPRKVSKSATCQPLKKRGRPPKKRGRPPTAQAKRGRPPTASAKILKRARRSKRKLPQTRKVIPVGTRSAKSTSTASLLSAKNALSQPLCQEVSLPSSLSSFPSTFMDKYCNIFQFVAAQLSSLHNPSQENNLTTLSELEKERPVERRMRRPIELFRAATK